LNASSAPEGGWTPQARADLEAMVKSAAGFNAERGDSLTLNVFPFSGSAAPLGTLPWWERGQLQELAKIGLVGLISLLMLLLVVRPVVRSLLQSRQLYAGAQSTQAAVSMGELSERQLHHAAGEVSGVGILGELNPLSEIRLPAPGSGLEMQIEHLQMLAKNDPERVSEVIKQWIGRNERDLTPAS
jgi:flagellar M-ring protein FliF